MLFRPIIANAKKYFQLHFSNSFIYRICMKQCSIRKTQGLKHSFLLRDSKRCNIMPAIFFLMMMKRMERIKKKRMVMMMMMRRMKKKKKKRLMVMMTRGELFNSCSAEVT